MDKFKKGDIVELIQASEKNKYSIGMEYEVVSDCYDAGGHMAYEIFNENDIASAECEYWTAREGQLRKKKPPEEPATWQEIQEISGWNPTKQKVTHNG